MPKDKVILGETFEDHRGTLRFFNSLDMREVVRFYEISPANTVDIRGWQAHKEEKKWFYCLKGTFIINIVEVNDFENPTNSLSPQRFVLKDSLPEVLCVPGGCATALRALTKDARLQIFSNFDLHKSNKDDFRFRLEQWVANWKS